MATPIQRRIQFSDNLPLSRQNRIDSLLQGTKWGGGVGTGVQGLEYSFVRTTDLLRPNYAVDQFRPTNVTGTQFLQDFQRLTDAQVAAADAAILAWADVANITFTRLVEPDQLVGKLENQLVGDIRFARSRHVNDRSTAQSQFPDSPEAGDIWLSVDNGIDRIDPATGLVTIVPGDPYIPNSIDAAGNLTSKGTYDYQTFLHEIGHALGLSHPHDGTTIATPDNDVQELTVMSYRSFLNQPLERYSQSFFPTTPMLNDIEAIQYLYGANTTTRLGNDVYNWSYFTENGRYTQFLQTIWDAGGIDEISWADAPGNQSVTINLNAGEWSELGLGYRTNLLTGVGQPQYPAFPGNQLVTRTVAITREVTINGVVINRIENATGGGGDDELIGNLVANVLNGGAGRDTMRGGQDNDTYYVDNVGDNVIELTNEGTDLVYSSSFSYTLSDNVENLTLIDGGIRGIGNELVNVITGNDQDNLLDGKQQNDTLYGGGGDDKLNGGIDADLLDGGTGSDTASYSTSSVGVTVNLATGQATGGDANGDTLISIEYLEGSEFGDILSGDSQNNRLWGLGGDDILDGGLGADSLFGGQGNDNYYVDNTNDSITENIDEGIVDSVFSSVTYTLSNNLENLTLTGNSIINGTGNISDNTITGNDSDNYLYGLDGNDTLIGGGGSDILDGGLGADSLFGGQGNDNYYVDNINDTITEYTNEGINNDNVYSSVTYRLSDYLENLTLTGTDAINGTGNTLDNTITGNSAVNTLNGGEGNDKLIGGASADTLNGGDGKDTASYFTATTGVTASLSASQNNTGDASGDIYQSIENLEGSEFNDRLFGDNLNNTLIGLSGDDFLDGYGGNDTLIGGKGNDTYKVYSAGDIVTESPNEGIDTVNASVDYTLAANVENLNLLEGTAALNGTGNELNNIINGNSARNTINGGAGNDTLCGFAGGDILTGGSGNDYFVYNAITDAGDRITDFTVGSDKLVFTDLLKNLGYHGTNAIADGIFSFKQASSILAVIQIDPDGIAGNHFRPAPFILLDNVSVAALNNSNNFVI